MRKRQFYIIWTFKNIKEQEKILKANAKENQEMAKGQKRINIIFFNVIGCEKGIMIYPVLKENALIFKMFSL